MNDGKHRTNWADLPPELTASILFRLSISDILENAQRVCRSWRRVCTKDPSMWRRIEMKNSENMNDPISEAIRCQAICRRAIDLSQGGLLEIYIEDFADNSLVSYIADSSSDLRRLGLAKCDYLKTWELGKALVKLPLLEDFELSHCGIADLDLDLKIVGRSCPLLKTLKLNRVDYYGFECDDEAFRIAETMHGLRHLQLVGNRMSDVGLEAILDSCPHLEYLDLRRCSPVDFVGDLRMRCLKRIKDVRSPIDSIADYPFHYIVVEHDSFLENGRIYVEAFEEDVEAYEEEEEEEEEEEDYSDGSDDNEYVYDDIYGDVDNHSDMDD